MFIWCHKISGFRDTDVCMANCKSKCRKFNDAEAKEMKEYRRSFITRSPKAQFYRHTVQRPMELNIG